MGARRWRSLALGFVVALGASIVSAKGHSAPAAADTPAQHRSNYEAGVPRDAHGRIMRDPHARNEFRHTHPCPATGRTSGPCRGYVIDHVQPLKRGGPDTPANMQWQSRNEARIKDRSE